MRPALSKFMMVVLSLAGSVLALPVSFQGSSGSRAASVSFDVSGNDLVVTLTNTSTADVLEPLNVLTAVFFDSSTSLTLSRISAKVPSGSTVLFGVTESGGGVGGEWAYRKGFSTSPAGLQYGISSSGLGLFGPGDRFPGIDLQPPASPDGLQYGITSAGDNPATGNTPVTGTQALIKNSVVFTLGGLPQGFTPDSITRVFFQYGTDLAEGGFSPPPHVIPEPATAMSVLMLGSTLLRRKRSR